MERSPETKHIAGDMNLTEGTVKQHISAILKKLQVNNRSQAILAAAPVLRNDHIQPVQRCTTAVNFCRHNLRNGPQSKNFA